MQKPASLLSTAALCAVFVAQTHAASAQVAAPNSTYRRHYVGSSLFMLGNLFPNPPSFYQLNYGYRLTRRDVVSVEAITWAYDAPLGIPYGPSFGLEEEKYPGSVRSVGLGATYQRFVWKNLYAAVHATSFLQTYRNKQEETIQQGYKLFCALRVGYHIPLFSNRFFVEPSVACTYWPFSTNMPQSFKAQENKWPNYFFEPGLHFGVKF